MFLQHIHAAIAGSIHLKLWASDHKNLANIAKGEEESQIAAIG